LPLFLQAERRIQLNESRCSAREKWFPCEHVAVHPFLRRVVPLLLCIPSL
jgi:hypothetical protein